MNNIPFTLVIFIVTGCLLGMPTSGEETAHSPLEVTFYHTHDTFHRERDQYFVDALNLALEKNGKPYHWNPIAKANQVERRDIANISSGETDVYWLHTSKRVEQVISPIRIPLFKGLVGWRIMVVRRDDKDLLHPVKTLSDLKVFRFVQGNDWPDTEILRANGLRVTTSVEFGALYRMLHHERAELLPRSPLEIWNELEDTETTGAVVDEHLVLVYPSAYYFFVADENKTLHQAIENGLNTAVADGSFNALFCRYFANQLVRAKLETRNVIHLDNPLLPPLTPMNRKELWYSVGNDDCQRRFN